MSVSILLFSSSLIRLMYILSHSSSSLCSLSSCSISLHQCLLWCHLLSVKPLLKPSLVVGLVNLSPVMVPPLVCLVLKSDSEGVSLPLLSPFRCLSAGQSLFCCLAQEVQSQLRTSVPLPWLCHHPNPHLTSQNVLERVVELHACNRSMLGQNICMLFLGLVTLFLFYSCP